MEYLEVMNSTDARISNLLKTKKITNTKGAFLAPFLNLSTMQSIKFLLFIIALGILGYLLFPVVVFTFKVIIGIVGLVILIAGGAVVYAVLKHRK